MGNIQGILTAMMLSYLFSPWTSFVYTLGRIYDLLSKTTYHPPPVRLHNNTCRSEAPPPHVLPPRALHAHAAPPLRALVTKKVNEYFDIVCQTSILPTSWASNQIRTICGLCMRRECRERFPHQRGVVIPTCITTRAWRTCRYACRGC